MEKLFETMVQSSPGIAACVIIVFLFLKAMRHMMDRYERSNVELVRENLEARAHSRMVIERNTEVVGENTIICKEMTEALKDLKFQRKSNI